MRHVTSKAGVATGLRADGHREVLGSMSLTPRTTCSGVSSSPASSTARPAGVKSVISDAHAGLVKAIGRCSRAPPDNGVACTRSANLLSAAHHRQRAMIAALVRTVFAQPDADTAAPSYALSSISWSPLRRWSRGP
jgi:putative transposase